MMATTSTIPDFFDKATVNSASQKRDRSSDSSTGISPSPKRAEIAPEEDDVTPPEDSPAWVCMVLKSMKKMTLRMDTLTDKIGELKTDTARKLVELTETVTFLADAYDDQKKTNKDLEDAITNQKQINEDLRTDIETLKDHQGILKAKCRSFQAEVDALEQYGRRNCLLIHGVAEQEDENTDTVFINTVSTSLGVVLDARDLDRSHRLGKPRQDGRPRPIIAKFSRYNARASVFAQKKKLKGSSVMLTESLTRTRVIVLQEARKRYGNTNVWTLNGEIYAKNAEGQKINVRTF